MTSRKMPLDAVAPIDSTFVALINLWSRDQIEIMLGFLWRAYDQMRGDMPTIDDRDLERSITQVLEPRIRKEMTGDEPFYVQHGPFERETMAVPPAQPPAYDLAFVMHADERLMWPIEAKVLETPNRLAEYERAVTSNFLTCRYAPFSGSAAMIGYLLTGSSDEALQAIATKLGVNLAVSLFPDRPMRSSRHERTVPSGKPYPKEFECYHLIFEFLTLTRQR